MTVASGGYSCMYMQTLLFAATVLAITALLAPLLRDCWTAAGTMLEIVHDTEHTAASADTSWSRALASQDPNALRQAVRGYKQCTASLLTRTSTSTPIMMIQLFMHWLGRPLRLRCMHRLAAGLELLREDLPAIAKAHSALIQEEYCKEEEITELFRFASCVAPSARGTILFAGSSTAAQAAFNAALALTGPGGHPVLSWTTRWQLPDQHTRGLRAQPWWMPHPAIQVLEAQYDRLLAEFLAVKERGGFERRRAEAWLPFPYDGWSMKSLLADSGECTRIAPETCRLVKQLQGLNIEPSTGCGYYLLKPGARLRPHAGPTNRKLTCHLTLEGAGAWITVGGERREWEVGKAFCFDDSYIHEAEHRGEKDRYVLLLDVRHPDLRA